MFSQSMNRYALEHIFSRLYVDTLLKNEFILGCKNAVHGVEGTSMLNKNN